MKQGKVKFFDETKGFGFIIPNDGTEEIFVHTTATNERIQENDEVTFDVEEGRRGLTAVNVSRV